MVLRDLQARYMFQGDEIKVKARRCNSLLKLLLIGKFNIDVGGLERLVKLKKLSPFGNLLSRFVV